MHTLTIQLTDQLSELAHIRQTRADIHQQIEIAEQALRNTEEYHRLAALRETYDTHTDQERDAANRTRALALAAYEATAAKRPAAGIQIKLFRQVGYDPADALAWCTTNAPFLLKHTINTAAFERLAPDIPDAPVQVFSEARAIIDADLSQYRQPAQAPGE